MIKIILARLTPEGMSVEGLESKEIFNLEINEDIKPYKDIEYNLNASLVNNQVLIKGTAKTVFKARCGKCLNIFDLKVCCKDICHLYETNNNQEIDLTEDIREDILIGLPLRIICSNSCKGICFTCGKNLNVEECSCSVAKETFSEWDKLNKLNL
ncbi:MAG TPA: DUF177 domain-containing protein [Victivallales bacterium]|nr:DUF177 domain-containing protein [Victivallales bacterium]